MWVSLRTSPEDQIEYIIRVLLRHIAYIINQLHDLDPTAQVLPLGKL